MQGNEDELTHSAMNKDRWCMYENTCKQGQTCLNNGLFMKILIVRTYPSVLDPAGYNIQEIGLAKALVRFGVTCDVVLYNGSSSSREKNIPVLKDNHLIGNVKVYLLKGYNLLKNGFFKGLSELLEEYDVIQVNEYDQISSWKIYTSHIDKAVVIFHGPYFDMYNRRYNLKCKIFDNTFLRFRHNREALCLTKSNAAKAFLLEKGFKKVETIGVGLDIENFDINSDDGDYHKSTDDMFNVIYVGKIEPRRNSMFLLDVMADVASQSTKIRFTVVGDGEDAYVAEWINKATPLIEKGMLTYHKQMSQLELKGLYKSMSLMVFPSNYEIFGMVILEAMYFDLPVLSSSNGGSDTLITDGFDGIVLDDFEIGIWSDTIIQLMNDSAKYDRIKQNLIQKDHSLYAWDGIAKRYLSLLELEFRSVF